MQFIAEPTVHSDDSAALSNPNSVASNGASNGQNGKTQVRIRTLNADDQLIACEMLRRLLVNEADIDIVGAASTGGDTVEAINRLQPDLVFLDIKMPGMDGFDVIKQLQG